MDFMNLWNICDPEGFAKGDDSCFSRPRNKTRQKSSDKNAEKEKSKKKISNNNNHNRQL